ncbi:MAG: hypothetical protein ACUVQR_12905 [Thermogutta sp.]
MIAFCTGGEKNPPSGDGATFVESQFADLSRSSSPTGIKTDVISVGFGRFAGCQALAIVSN